MGTRTGLTAQGRCPQFESDTGMMFTEVTRQRRGHQCQIAAIQCTARHGANGGVHARRIAT